MTAEPQPIRRKAAKRPAPRRIEVGVAEGDYAGWQATINVDFSARVLADLESANVERILVAARKIIVHHNMPDEAGEVAEDLADVVPFQGLVAVLTAGMGAIQALPPR